MRWVKPGLVCLILASAGCSEAPDRDDPGEAVTTASGVAFAYHYNLSLPSGRIAEAQERHAQACEQLASNRCRITGMTYRLDKAGQVTASLDVSVAAPIARGFGRRGVQGVEAAGGTLVGAEIVGTDTAAATGAADVASTNASSDRADIERELTRANLSERARADLLNRRAELIGVQRESAGQRLTAQASTAFTPVSFTYAAGTGVGLAARLTEAGQAGYLSLTWTLATALTLLAYLGPPVALLLLLLVLWHRVGRHWWARAFPERVKDELPSR